MRIAIPTNDKEHLFKRSGRAKGFLIMDIEKDAFSVVDYRKNNHTHNHDHSDNEQNGHSHKEAVDALKDCRYLMVNMVGKHFVKDLKDAGIQVFITDKEAISDAVEEFKVEILP